jgi:hypothetical protein
MKNILAQLNDISSALEDAGLISEASAVHDVFVKVAKKKKSKKNVPNDPELYSRCKAEVKSKFEVWPSAYGSMALTKLYKSRGGTYKTE